MYLTYAIHPITQAFYYFPIRQADLTVANNRRNSTFVVPGGGGPINPKGMSAFDREPNVIAYQFQINPIGEGGIGVDAQRDAFVRALDHGLPQTLAFSDDADNIWWATCALVESQHHQLSSSDASHIMQASWVLLSDYLHAPVTPGTAIYSRQAIYNEVVYGRLTDDLTLTQAVNILYLDNQITNATAATTDPVFTITGPFSPGGGHTSAYNDCPLAIYAGPGGYGAVFDIGLGAADKLVVDYAARRVTLNDQPAFGHMRRWPNPIAPSYISILPDVENYIQVWIGNGQIPVNVGNGTSVPYGVARIQWHPKRSI
jgi:hypothetical protein